MKIKFILFAILMVLALVLLSGCDIRKASVDIGKYAIISLPNGEVVEGEIESITRWSSSYFEIEINGVEYFVHPLKIAIVGKEVTENE
jgi:hypothetical protein